MKKSKPRRKNPIEPPEEFFNVVQFFASGGREYVKRRISAEEAVKDVMQRIYFPAARAGLVNKIIITDNGDFMVFEWQYKKGVVFPPPK